MASLCCWTRSAAKSRKATIAEPSFCALCRSALEQRRPLPSDSNFIHDDYQFWDRAFPDLEAAAAQGCRICKDVHKYILDPSPLSDPLVRDLLDFTDEDRHSILVRGALEWDGKTRFDKVKFEFWSEDKHNYMVKRGFLVYYLFPTSSLRQLTPALSMHENQDNLPDCACTNGMVEDVFELYRPLVETWLETCSKEHSACGPSFAKWLPTRLIDLGSLDTTTEPRLVTHLDPSSARQVSYATLSHRWALNSMPILTTLNIGEYKVRLPLEDLPRTFLDAIHIARKLGIKYLWIDSLCIIQDSIEDWQHESVLMAKIYESGVLNLAGTGASLGRDGLYPDSVGSLEVEEGKIKCGWGAAASTGGRSFYLVREMFWSSHVTDSPLNARGWVLQERILSPRTVYFGLDRLYWECRERSACSLKSGCSLSELSWSQRSMERLNRKSPILKHWRQVLIQKKAEHDNGLGTIQELYSPWKSIVVQYSKTSLTKNTDKLVALSGLAKSFQDILQDQYIAGLWRKTLLYDLLWEVNDLSGCKRPATYHAPSWSWASIDSSPTGISAPGPPRYQHESHQIAEIINVNTNPIGQDPTGQIESASLTIRGIILPFLQQMGESRRFQFDMKHQALRCFVARYDEFNVPTSGLDKIFCLPLAVDYSWVRLVSLRGLALRVVDQQRDKYVRIGSFNFPIVAAEYYRLQEAVCSEKGVDSQHRLVTII